MRFRFTRTIKLLLVTLATVTGLVVATQTPALADTTCSNSGFICAWTSANYTGQKMLTNFVGCQNIPSPWNDNITSLKVNSSPSSNDWILYIDPNCTGDFITYNNGTSIADLASAVDNKFSSMKRA